MKITVCIGSSCHIKGSRQVVEQLQSLVHEADLGDSIELAGTFCMGRCQEGVCVTVDGDFFRSARRLCAPFSRKQSCRG